MDTPSPTLKATPPQIALPNDEFISTAIDYPFTAKTPNPQPAQLDPSYFDHEPPSPTPASISQLEVSPEVSPEPSQSLEPETQAEEPTYTISLFSPRKVGMDGVNAYMLYKVRTVTDSKLFKFKDTIVERRFSDFLWLYTQLCQHHPGVIVPPLPEKLAIGRFQPEFVEKRRIGLELFLKRTTCHPSLYNDPQLVLFLESPALQADIEARKRLANKTLLSVIGDAFSSMTATKFIETDQWFERYKAQLDRLQQDYKLLHASASKMVMMRRDSLVGWQELSESLQSLVEADVDGDDPVARECRWMLQTLKQAQQLQERMKECDLHTLERTLDEYERMFASIKDAYASRIKAYQTWQMGERQVHKNRAALERARTTTPDQVTVLVNQLLKSQQDALQLHHTFDRATGTLRDELIRFDMERCNDMKHMAEHYIQQYKSIHTEWTRVWHAVAL